MKLIIRQLIESILQFVMNMLRLEKEKKDKETLLQEKKQL